MWGNLIQFPRERMPAGQWRPLLPTVEYWVPSKRLNLLSLLLIAISLLILTSCAHPTASGATDSFCLIAKPIAWSTKDTDETIKEVKEHNAKGKAICGWGGPALQTSTGAKMSWGLGQWGK